MKSFLVIGLGRFGRHLTRYLLELGNEVMVLDKDEEKVAKVAGMATAACVGDCQDEQVLGPGRAEFRHLLRLRPGRFPVLAGGHGGPEGAGGPVRGGPGGPGAAD